MGTEGLADRRSRKIRFFEFEWRKRNVVTEEVEAQEMRTEPESATLLYQGQASIRIVTDEGKVIYIDPYAGDSYELGHGVHGNSSGLKPCICQRIRQSFHQPRS